MTWENPSYYFRDGTYYCIDHDEELDSRYGCRYCPEEANT